MQCETFERRLHQLLDERLRPEDDPQLRRHADACPACGARLAAQAALWEGLAQRPTPQTSEGFVEAVMGECGMRSAECGMEEKTHRAHAAIPRANSRRLTASGGPRHPKAKFRNRKTIAACLTAAAVLLALAPAGYWSLRGKGQPNSSPIAERERNAPTLAAPHVSQFPVDSPQTAETPSPADEEEPTQVAENLAPRDGASLAAAAGTSEERYALLLEQWRTQLPRWGDTLGLTDADAPTVQGAAAVSQLTDRLRTPLSASIESTLNVLRGALPASTEQTPVKPQALRPPLSAAAFA